MPNSSQVERYLFTGGALSMNVSEFHDGIREQWEHYVNQVQDCTIFHSLRWKTIIEKSFPHRPCYLYVEDNGIIKGILPLFMVRGFTGKTSLVSVPQGVYGGIVADSQEAACLLLEEARRKAHMIGVSYLELRHLKAFAFDLPTKDLYVTFQTEISPDLDRNLGKIPRKQRRMIRVGEKAGLEARIEDGPLDSFYNIYAQSVRNLGTPVFSYRYFEHIQSILGEGCKILSVWHGSRMVAGVMTFFFRDWVMPYYAGALKEYFRYAVNDFMYWSLLRYACEHGYRIFDFGRSKQGTGAYEFKRHWGFEPQALAYQYDLYSCRTMPDLSPKNTFFQPFIAIWKHLPLPIAKFLGPHILNYIP